MKKILLLPLLIVSFIVGYSQGKVVTGKIADQANKPLAGATVTLKGTTVNTVSDESGNFEINTGTQVNPVLTITFVGYLPQEYSVRNRSGLSIQLQQDVQALNDVVVIGYGVQRKKDVTGASSTVKAGEIAKRPLVRIEQALQGTTPGVAVISPNGQPGQGLKVKIRGANSITGSTEPLYVIDGDIGGGSDVNVNDVENIEILKDAASTAIYGSRGSNGVVLITTKSGASGKPKLGFGAWVQKNKIPKELDLMGPYDFARSVNAQFVAQGSAPAFTDQELADFKSGAKQGTDWQRALHTEPWVQNYQLDLSGGTDIARYRFSMGYLDQPGIILNQWYKRTSFRSNVDVKVSNKINLKVIAVATIPQSHNNDYGGGLGDPFNQAVEWDPTSPIRDANGNYITHSKYASIQFNPIAQAESQAHDNINTNLSGTGVITYRMLNDLTFTSTNVYSLGMGYGQRVDGPGTSAYDGKTDNAQVNSNRFRSFLTSNYLTYKHNFGDHAITVTGLYEFSSGQNTSVNATAKNLSTYSLGYYNLGLGSTQNTSSGYTADALISYMGRLFYSYKDKYMLSASVRTDGSSHLAQKYSTFPSIGVAWNVKKENFMQKSDFFSDLKVRATYGQTGNQAVAPYSTIPVINIGGGNGQNAYYYNGGNSTPSVAVSLGTPVSTSLRWENKATYDAGIDAAFLKGRLTFTVDAYSSKVTNLLYNNQAPQYLGGGSYAANVGSLSNKGIEFGIGGTPISTKNLRWNTNLNVSINRNKVIDLGGLDNILAIGGNNTFNSVIKIGQPLGEFIGYKFLGTWKADEATEASKFGMKPGDAKYQDLNGDHAYTADDWMPLGNATPSYTYGFINDISYKDFTLTFMFQGQQGSQVFSQTLAYLWGGLGDMKNATTIEAVPENLWTPHNETNNPAWSGSSHNYNNSSRYVYNSSYTKLKNISLSYHLPPGVLRSLHLTSLEVYISGQNLWVMTPYKGYDPEIDQQPTGNAISQGQEFGVIPNPKSYTFGVRMSL
ncbi:TonB-dependent receptor [Danxiaibacter flavus]|uniref:TonB-dependent receptor n=1 Tax=Danxiaibacter flavus TaxID=3049108 RepID=A0ABV3ZE91_9BACT|nr:TonB-dependent receptor [Chitinophagaceae bacterium DXS]